MVRLPGTPATQPRADWLTSNASGAGTRIAVIDSGIDASHPDLEGSVDEGDSAWVVMQGGRLALVEGPHGDLFGHGTACAGIAHSIAPGARISSIRVFGPELSGRPAALVLALEWAIDRRFDVINISLGTSRREWALELHELCDAAYFAGCLVVTAANNVAAPSFPSLFASVISVACNLSENPKRYHYNPQPPTEFLARGVDVEVPWMNHQRIVTTGNSYAAPHIAGLAALIKSTEPQLRPFQLKAALWAGAANILEAPTEAAGRFSRAAMTAQALPRQL